MTWDSIFSAVPATVASGAVFLFVTRAIVREEVSKLDGKYMSKDLAAAKFEEIEKHFDYLRDKKAAHGD